MRYIIQEIANRHLPILKKLTYSQQQQSQYIIVWLSNNHDGSSPIRTDLLSKFQKPFNAKIGMAEYVDYSP